MPAQSCIHTRLNDWLISSGASATTTTVALTFTLYYILSISRVWDRLGREIRSTFHAVEEITEQSTAGLVFLDAVIREGAFHFEICLMDSVTTKSRWRR